MSVEGGASALAADAARKRKKRSSDVFEGDAALKELWSRLADAPTNQAPEPPLARSKTSILGSAVRLMGVAGMAAAGALGFLWITSPHGSRSPKLQAGKEVAPVSLRGTPGPAAPDVAAKRAPDPSVTVEQAAGAALYQDFLKWRQLRGN